jgi:Reverse transcriptase (RNA-dependent DNA polymerase)
MDVVSAFLAGTIHEKAYFEQPEGFEQGDNLVCFLDKALYGLKQAPRVWN